MSSSAPGTVWRLSAVVAGDAVSAVETALDPFCPALTMLETADGSDIWRVEGFTEDRPDEAALRAALAEIAAIQGVFAPDVTIEAVAPRDWVAENLETFPPLTVGRYYVYGSHVTAPPPPGAVALHVDTGAAFGSGRHESTSGCLAAFDRLAYSHRFRAMLDMGCGSAILGMAMAKTWRRDGADVLAVDIDPRSVEVAADNARLNGVADRVTAMVGRGYSSARVRRGAPYDLIVANILARPLIRMAKDAARHLDRGGYLVLAGFLTRDWRRVYAAHQMQGLTLADRIDVGEWTTLVLRKGR